MELLAYPKSNYLLQASLDDLHIESREWQNEIVFWQDELSFFYKLLHQKEKMKNISQEKFMELDKQLNTIVGELENLKLEIQSHERLLASLLKSNSVGEEVDYRHLHRKLLHEIFDINLRIKNFKITIFSLFKSHD